MQTQTPHTAKCYYIYLNFKMVLAGSGCTPRDELLPSICAFLMATSVKCRSLSDFNMQILLCSVTVALVAFCYFPEVPRLAIYYQMMEKKRIENALSQTEGFDD